MPSIHPDYEYDIFISYRQNDNKRDGWVTNFVEALKDELEATLKNPVSIYFDENPHDGLLETHQVDASLAKKLKCLVFIPIVSQTYCDETCFAWQHEFMPFINMAKEDALGMNVTLSNGNVVSRVLPVKIHELDTEDHNTLEAVLDGPLRSIDFIYQQAGVNRPLRANEDDPSANLNKTFYRDQINKVANALKDIGLSILRSADTGSKDSPPKVVTIVRPATISSGKKEKKRKLVIPLIFVVALIAAYFLLKPYLFQQTVDKKISEVGLAVMPLKNYANDQDIDVLSYALRDEIHELLALNKKFAFLSSTTATATYKDKDITPQEIGHELGVDYVLAGSYQISGDQLNVRVEFADAETGNSVWSHKFIVKYEAANIFPMQADIAQKVLAIFNETGENELQAAGTINLEAYSHYIKGLEWMNKGWEKETLLKAIMEFERAIGLDSAHSQSWIELIECKSMLIFQKLVSDTVYLSQIEDHIMVLANGHPQWSADLANGIYQYHALGNYEKGFTYFKRVLAEYPDNEMANSLTAALHKRKLNNALAFKYSMKTINLNPNSATNWNNLIVPFRINGDYQRQLKSLTKALELGLDSTYYSGLIILYSRNSLPLDSIPEKYRTGNDKRIGLYKIWEDSNPRKNIELTKNIQLDAVPGPNKYTKTEYYLDIAVAYQALYLDDSARYFAKLSIAENDQQVEKEWYWVSDVYSLLGDVEKATEIFKREYPVDDEDLLLLTWQKIFEIRSLVLAKRYAEATEVLLELNRDYPEYGDFHFLTRFVYNRAKKEYPPFAEAVANLKLPEPLVKEDGMERLKY